MKNCFGNASTCSLSELYEMERDILAKLVGYLLLIKAANLAEDSKELIASLDQQGSLIAYARNQFMYVFMEFGQAEKPATPAAAQMKEAYLAAQNAPLMLSVQRMADCFRLALELQLISLKGDEHVRTLGSLLSDLFVACQALEGRLLEVQAAWSTLERIISHPDDAICQAISYKVLMQIETISAQMRAGSTESLLMGEPSALRIPGCDLAEPGSQTLHGIWEGLVTPEAT